MNSQPVRPFGLRFNDWFEKYMFIVIPVSLILGFLFYPVLSAGVDLVPYLFAYLTFVMALGCSARQIRDALRQPLAMATTFALAHVAAPLAGYGAGALLFGADSPYTVGLVLFAAIPLGVSSVIWIGLSGGNVSFALAMIVLDSIVSPFVVPFIVDLFFGAHIEFDVVSVMSDLAVIVVIPTILGVIVNALTRGRAKPWSAPVALPTSKLAFFGVVMINSAAIAPHVIAMKRDMAALLPVVVALVALCYAMGWFGAFPFRGQPMKATFAYCTAMRNISLGIVIALQYFEPAAAVPVVMSILIQQPMATLQHSLLKRLAAASKGMTLRS